MRSSVMHWTSWSCIYDGPPQAWHIYQLFQAWNLWGERWKEEATL